MRRKLYNTSLKGFTIIELLIVIVVVGILTGITASAYTGIQQRAHNTSVSTSAKQFHTALMTYKALNGKYPPVPADVPGEGSDSRVCLGSGYEGNVCGDTQYPSKVFAPFDDALSNLIEIPKGSTTVIDMPYSPGETWTGVAFIDDEGEPNSFSVEGEPNPHYMMYVIFGGNADCGLKVATEDPNGPGWPHMVWSSTRYSYSDGKTTACVVPLEN